MDRDLLSSLLQISLDTSEFFVAWTPVSGEGAAAIITKLAPPSMDMARVDAEVAGGLGNVARALSGADGFELYSAENDLRVVMVESSFGEGTLN